MQTLRYIELANTLKQRNAADFPASMRINLVTNFTDTTLQKLLVGVCLESNIYPQLYCVPYKQYNFFLHNKDSQLHSNSADITFIFFDINHYITSAFSEDISHFSEIIERVQEFCQIQNGPVVFCTLAWPYMGPFGNLFNQSHFYSQVQEYNAQLHKLAQQQKNLFIFDINRLLHFFGERNARDYRGLYAFDMPFTNDFLLYVANEWLPYIYALAGKTKKCIVVDLDNTLWGGIVGEVGLNGIALGPEYPGVAFQNFQRALLECYNRGMILAINSRNNMTDVDEVFERHPYMILKKEHFAATKINWNDKAQNLIEIANELNIGMDSLVFFDDDPVNRELVKSRLPDVIVPHFTISPEEYIQTLFSLNIFSQFRLTEEDKSKGKMYAAELTRKNIISTAKSPAEYMAQLAISMQIRCNSRDQLERLAQLTNKTNQFNLTTRRYAETAVEGFMKEGLVYGGTVKDKFGDYGLTIMAIVEIKDKIAAVDSFLMSCRVMGREIEKTFLDYIIRDLHAKGVERITAKYIPTAKNIPAKDFYASMDFKIIQSNEEAVDYELTADEYLNNHETAGTQIELIINN
ncbi:MAG: HAD-IIIC family phosphatase [Candidatus Magasanikbacteria bacterium]|nr:HAD-IIIC family phosphatase [Candidatus Magasanikbacteria bacterium]